MKVDNQKISEKIGFFNNERTQKYHYEIEFEWWNGIWEASVYAGFKQICLSVGNDLATFSTSRTK